MRTNSALVRLIVLRHRAPRLKVLTITRKRGNSVKFTGERQSFTGEVPLFTGEEGRLSAFYCGAA
jgi:hypothetical protein